MAKWINKTTDENFTALHFAAYHGNLKLSIKLVEEMGANFNARNIYGANVLHIAAQGD
jgi:ankyrin repeat protein